LVGRETPPIISDGEAEDPARGAPELYLRSLGVLRTLFRLLSREEQVISHLGRDGVIRQPGGRSADTGGVPRKNPPQSGRY